MKPRSFCYQILSHLLFFAYPTIGQVHFTEVSDTAGISFVHAGGLERHENAAVLGSGCAFVDYDNDGDLDIYLVNTSESFPDVDTSLPTNSLFQNNGDGTFKNVTESSNLGDTGWGMGCAFADYDNDGDLDLYLSNDQANVFFKNLGSGMFKRATSSAGGLGDNRFGSSIGWADYDNDGDTDLYVTNTQSTKSIYRYGIFVITCCYTYWINKP